MKVIHTDLAPAAIGPYSQGIISGKTLYLSGQIPLDPDSGAVVGADITAQTQQVLAQHRCPAGGGGHRL